MEKARGISVPMQADSVASPEIRYNVGMDDGGMTCIVFVSEELDGQVGRITIEGLDSIRCCRGEYEPYPSGFEQLPSGKYPWVFEIENSAWLRERHEYESKHYQTPLLDEYIHYLFSFHDEFIELIAKGIWFEKLSYEEVGQPQENHPLADLPMSLPCEKFDIADIECELRWNPLAKDGLLNHSRLCSQTAFQYYMTLDGTTKPSYSALVRTIRGQTKSRLRGSLFYRDRFETDGLPDESKFRMGFAKYVKEVAARRKQMGK